MVNIKKVMALMLTAIVSFSTLASCGGNQKDNSENVPGGEIMNEDVKLWTAPSTRKIVINEEPSESSGSTLNISMVKNEKESAQLVITPEKKNVVYDLKVSDLKCGDNTIPAEDIKLYREHYVYLTHSGNPDLVPNYYPDALIPFDKVKAKEENKVRKGQNQPIFVEVETKEDTVSGVYTGNLTVTLNGDEQLVPINVKVANVTIPKENHAKTAYAIWEEGNFLHGFFDDTQDYYKIYYDYLLENRISGTFIPGTQHTMDSNTTVTDLVNSIEEYALNDKVSSYCLPYTRCQVYDETNQVTHNFFDVDKLEKIMIELVNRSTNEKNLLEKAYIYFDFCDEPDVSQAWRIRKTDLAFYNLKERIINNGSLYPKDGSKDKVRDSIKNIHHVATVSDQENYYPLNEEGEYVGGVETFCPLWSEFQSNTEMENYLYRKDHGLESWFYGCVNPKAPYPTFHVDDRGVSPRLVGWMQKYYDIEGELYWVTNLTQRFNLDLWKYFSIDPWTNPYTGWIAPGDGMILYPGKKYDINGPIPSLRFKYAVDGKEDYELLLILEKALNEASETYKRDFSFQEYVKSLVDMLFYGTIVTDDNNNFDNIRNEIISLVELLKNDSQIVLNQKNSSVGGKTTLEVYSKNDIKLTVNGNEVKYSKMYLSEEGKYLYTYDHYMTSGSNRCDITFTENGKTYSMSKYLGTGSKMFTGFNTKEDIGKTGKTDGAKEFQGIMGEPKNDTKISLNIDPQFSKTGNSLKLEYEGVTDNPGYRPGIKLINDEKEHNYSKLSKVSFDVYNPNYNFTIYLAISAYTKDGSDKTEPMVTDRIGIKHGWNKVVLKAEGKQTLDYSRITGIDILTDNPIYESDGVVKAGKRELYFDNILFIDKIDGIQENIVTRDVVIEDDGFNGLYDLIPNPMNRPVAEDGTVIDFEDFAKDVQPYATFMKFEGIQAKMTINNDKKYISHGDGSLKVECKTGDTARSVEVWFNMPYTATNFIEQYKSISFDVFNPMGLELDYVFTTSKDKGGATYQLEKSKLAPNKMTHYSYNLNELLDPHKETEYDDRDNVAIWIIRFTLPPQSDITLYFDNFAVQK